MASVPAPQRRRLLSRGELVDLASGDILGEPGAAIVQVYFPVESIVAQLAGARSGAALEVGLVGAEGMLGATLMLGVPTSPLRWLVQQSGPALRIPSADFVAALAESTALRRVVARYLYVVLMQLAQTACCKRFHVVEARLARWLLMTRDRAHSSSFHLTHERLALIMGVRRAGITRAASALQRRRVIRYARGDVRILDGPALESASCSCYSTDNEEYVSAMAARWPSRRRKSLKPGRALPRA